MNDLDSILTFKFQSIGFTMKIELSIEAQEVLLDQAKDKGMSVAEYIEHLLLMAVIKNDTNTK